MEEQVAQKSSELEHYLQRVRELEDMYHQLTEALEEERQAKQDEEAMRKLQARSNTHTHTHTHARTHTHISDRGHFWGHYIDLISWRLTLTITFTLTY